MIFILDLISIDTMCYDFYFRSDVLWRFAVDTSTSVCRKTPIESNVGCQIFWENIKIEIPCAMRKKNKLAV